MLGLVVLGSRTWMWTTAAPALAASTHDCAISAGLTGTAGFFPGESAEPVTAHEMMTLRCIGALSKTACDARPRANSKRASLASPHPSVTLAFGRRAQK